MMASRVATLRGLWASTWLGWQVSSNWTSPLLFLSYIVMRPVSAALILAVMYRVIAGPASTPYLAFLVTGTAFWAFVQNGISGFSNAIADDRGRYRMLKYVYIAPQRLGLYLLGRATAELGSAVLSIIVVLGLATVALKLPIDARSVDYPLLFIACALATVTVVSIAQVFCLTMLTTHDSYGYGELGAQTLYILSGAIFPVTVLPGALGWLAQWSPLASWLELVRRALMPGRRAVMMFPDVGNGAMLLRLGIETLVVVLLGRVAFARTERFARRHGYFDRDANW
jgi:ABC-2 type transport system permease protein